ncbi:MAG: NUDIX domain-containing protein [Rhodospirillales bacterium]|nr:NUDIX domain-containing protein [Rhodospirillales bacterium]
MEAGFLRHIAACNNAALPGRRIRLLLGAHPVGWVLAELAARLAVEPGAQAGADGIRLPAGADLNALARVLADEGRTRWRGEAFAVRAEDDTNADLGTVDRGALPALGLIAHGVHVNGLVRRADGLFLWVARRAADKALDPGKLDHLVAGGVPAELDARRTLIKEAAEEAAIPAELAATARPVGEIVYAMERAEGLRRDRLFCFDLDLPEDFVPWPADGEVAGFELWPIARAVEAVRATDAFKFNVNLVLIDLFRRLGLIDA